MRLLPVFALLLASAAAHASEEDALAISKNIQARHMPYGAILDPVLSGSEVVSYTRCGDSALWTGHYLAAEAFRYAVTGSAEALRNASAALSGIRSLLDVTGSDVLARCAVPVESPYAADLTAEEARHGVFLGSLGGESCFWIGNTSRDQYAGVFFGLGAAYDLLPEGEARAAIRDLATRMMEFLLDHEWFVVMPNGSVSTTFLGRPDQQLALLQVARHVNPRRFESVYKTYRAGLAGMVMVPISAEVLGDHDSYFKFNLDTIGLYNLLRLEGSGWYRFWYSEAYNVLRRTTGSHGNAHFNMIDRALKGPNEKRDAETRALLKQWLERPRLDDWVDWRGTVAACGGADRACAPLGVAQRVRTDFLWQRSPFLLFGGGAGNIEGAGIDYILPYWMARYYKVL